jgi:RNAse (barnase) inhibitor barstar
LGIEARKAAVRRPSKTMSASDPLQTFASACHTVIMSTEYVLDGSRLTSLQTIYDEMDNALGLPAGETPNFDWLDDLLSGGIKGIPDDGIVVRWINSEVSRQQLGPQLFGQLQNLMQSNRNVHLLLE